MPVAGGFAVADLTTLEARLTAARAAYLDNIDADIKELCYEHFSYTIDDQADAVISGDSVPANLFDNDVTVNWSPAGVGDKAIITFLVPAYIKQYRTYGDSGSDPGGKYKIQAYVDGAWVDCIVNIPDSDADEWGAWTNLTTPRTSRQWSFEVTVKPAPLAIGELELMGVIIGA